MTKTEENLKAAFAGESQARNKYTYFAKVARNQGYHYVANIFEETAMNEMQHAKDEFKLLKGIGDTEANLKAAIEGEHYEWTKMYPEFATFARQEGEDDALKFFTEVSEIEMAHEARYKKLLEDIQRGKVFKKDRVLKWKCRNCGYIHSGREAPMECPNCLHPRNFFEVLCENY